MKLIRASSYGFKFRLGLSRGVGGKVAPDLPGPGLHRRLTSRATRAYRRQTVRLRRNLLPGIVTLPVAVTSA